MRLPHDAQFLALQMTILLTSCVAEFKEIRKEWKQRKKEEEAQRKAEEERQRQQAAAAAQNGGGEPQGPDGTPTSTYGSRPVQLPPIGYQPAPYPAPSSGGVPQQQLPDYGTSTCTPATSLIRRTASRTRTSTVSVSFRLKYRRFGRCATWG